MSHKFINSLSIQHFYDRKRRTVFNGKEINCLFVEVSVCVCVEFSGYAELFESSSCFRLLVVVWVSFSLKPSAEFGNNWRLSRFEWWFGANFWFSMDIWAMIDSFSSFSLFCIEPTLDTMFRSLVFLFFLVFCFDYPRFVLSPKPI